MKKLLGAAGLAMTCFLAAAQTSPPPGVVAPLPLPRSPEELKAMMQRRLPPMPHEAEPQRWPQPDYFAEALALTGRRPDARARTLRVAGSAPLAALPVQTQAFGFSAAFRALLGAELDLQLEERGLEATAQTEAFDAWGPFVRRFDEPALTALASASPARRLVLLYAGHDGVDRLFLTLVVRDAAGQKSAHESLALPADPAAALTAAGGALQRLLPAAGLAGRPAALAAGSGACGAERWSVDALATPRDLRQQACQALVAGSLLPDFEPPWRLFSVSTPARLAWLARAYVRASRAPADDAVALGVRGLAWHQLSLAAPGSLPAAPPDDPVLSRIGRLLALPALRQAPVQSTREVQARQTAALVAGLPRFAAALLQYRADLADNFARLDLCDLEQQMPGLMLRGSCRERGPSGAPARPATAFERLAYQEWRLAVPRHELQRLGGALGRPQDAADYAAALPRDVAEHPFVQRAWRHVVAPDERATSFEQQLARALDAAERDLVTLVTVQRHDEGARRGSISAGLVSPNLNIVNEPGMRVLSDDDLRLMSVLRFDRFEPGAPPPDVRATGDGAYFLEPDRGLVRAAQMTAQMARLQRLAAQAPPASAPVVPYKRRPFGQPWPDSYHAPEAELDARQKANPMHMPTRVGLALARLKRGAPLSEAIALLNARPPNERTDERIGESHAWAEPAHAFFFAGEPDAARGFYERVMRIGTGSQSDLYARTRVPQIAGRLDEHLGQLQVRQRRYESDYGRRDIAALQFMRGQRDAAWALLLTRLATSQVVPLWHAVLAGHRLEGADLKRLDTWFAEQRLEKAQIDHSDVDRFYVHLFTTVDRLPGDAELERLRRRKEALNSWTEPRYAASAMLVRSLLSGAQHAEARDAVLKVVEDDNGERNRFLLPQFAWVAWQASQGRDGLLDDVRAADLDGDFDALLAKAYVLALDGKVDESLRYLKAARFELAHLGLGSDQLLERPLPAPYQWVLAAHVLHRHTGREEFRSEGLRFARAYQRVQPYWGWAYALEASWEKDPALRQAAACRARYLDAGSYFLAQAKVHVADERRCKASLW